MKIISEYKKHIINIIFSIITYLSILIHLNISFTMNSYDIVITLTYFLILLFYYKVNVPEDSKIEIYSCILALILSSLLCIGDTVYDVVYMGAVRIFNLENIIITLFCILGFFLMLYRIFSIMFSKIDSVKVFEGERKNRKGLKIFFLVFGIIILCWLPYFLRYYPAIMTPDSYYTIYYADSGILSDFHTFGHTWFFGVFFFLGKILFSNMNMAVAFSIIIQMITMASIFAYAIMYLYKIGVKKSILILGVLIYSLSPLYAHYSITLWRDVVFGGAFVLLFIVLLEFNFFEDKLKKSTLVLFIVSILLIMFFRNNGIYICILLLPFLLLFKINSKKIVLITYILLLLFYFIIKGPVFTYFNVEKSTTVEAFSIPLQQIARTIAIGKEIDEESKQYLSEIMDIDLVKEKYASAISDPIKNITNNEKLSETKGDFFKVWLKNLIRYPKVYIEAYFTQTLGYWYPNVSYWATGGESKSIFESVNVYSDPVTPDRFNNFIDKTATREYPLANLIWSIGTVTFILIISTFIFIYINKTKYLLCYIPLYLLLFSILISTPVFAELRYVYGLFTCIPLLLIAPFIVTKKE